MIRQFRALSVKNWINWKRTPISSLLEIFIPVALMFLLVVIRRQIPPYKISTDEL